MYEQMMKSIMKPKDKRKDKKNHKSKKTSIKKLNNPEQLAEFMALEPERQRSELGKMLFPLVQKLVDKEQAPKITGMLIDLNSF